MPVTAILREAVYEAAYKESYSTGTLSNVPFKLRIVNDYLQKIVNATELRPRLTSDFTITLTFTNDEFNSTDMEYLTKKFPELFRPPRKRRHNQIENFDAYYTKVRVAGVAPRLDKEFAQKYMMASPTRACSFEVTLERNPLFIAGRYCKYSRSLPQSPWTSSKDVPKIVGNSVSEKIAKPLIEETGCEHARFIASGREDIDVRMLGTGRPFVMQLINPRRTASFRKNTLSSTLQRLEASINTDKDVKLYGPLQCVSVEDATQLKNNQEDKKKCYTAYCCSTNAVDDEMLSALNKKAPLNIMQKTPVRVLKRRPLLKRERSIYAMKALKIDDHHFLVRLETQAGTYVKEFVHGDFGRTRPCLTDLLDDKAGEVDILELDVEGVYMDWPPVKSVDVE